MSIAKAHTSTQREKIRCRAGRWKCGEPIMNPSQKIFVKATLIYLLVVFYISIIHAWQWAYENYLQIPSGWRELQLIQNCSINTFSLFLKYIVSPVGAICTWLFTCSYFYFQFQKQKFPLKKAELAFHIFVALSAISVLGFYAYHSSIGKLYVLIFAIEYISCEVKAQKSLFFKFRYDFRFLAKCAAAAIIAFSCYYFVYAPVKFRIAIQRVKSAQTASEEKRAFQFAKKCGKISKIWFVDDETRFSRFPWRNVPSVHTNKHDMRLTITWLDASPFTHQQYQAQRMLIDTNNLEIIGYRPPIIFVN